MKKENKSENKDPIDPHLRVAAEDKLLRSSGSSSEMKAGTPEELLHELRVHQIELEMQNKELRKAQRALERSRKRYADLRKAMRGIIQVISDTGEYKNSNTAIHQRRVANIARALGGEMGLAEDQQNGLLLGGTIHDLGKAFIPAEILNKPTKLTKTEYKLIQTHSRIGADILKGIELPWPITDMVHQHHERMDGSGYPGGLKGEEISMEAQILMVADVVEAMASYRPYRPALGIDAALVEIENKKGTLYDADTVDACLRLFREKGFQLAEHEYKR